VPKLPAVGRKEDPDSTVPAHAIALAPFAAALVTFGVALGAFAASGSTLLAGGAVALVAALAVTALTRERRAAVAALARSEDRARRIVASAHEAFVAIDAAGTITDWNPQAEAVFGFSRPEAVGRSLAETIIPAELREAHREGLRRFLVTGEGSVVNRLVALTATGTPSRSR
jgi:PAS domain S-box-containing protein